MKINMDLINNADKLAKQFILNNQSNIDELKNNYNNGLSSDNLAFAYHFSTACADYTAQFISKGTNPNDNLDEGVKRFAEAVLPLNNPELSFAIESLKNKLASVFVEFTLKTKDGYELIGPIRKRIADVINSNPNCNENKRDLLIKVITDYDKMQTSTRPKINPERTGKPVKI